MIADGSSNFSTCEQLRSSYFIGNDLKPGGRTDESVGGRIRCVKTNRTNWVRNRA
jgi:hypothetical protein